MLDTCIAIRAAAILIIVAGHADFFSVARDRPAHCVPGDRLPAGKNCSWPQVLQRDSARPLLSLVGKIVLPVMAYTAATSCVGALPHYSNFLMVANLFAMPARGIEPHIWFVHRAAADAADICTAVFICSGAKLARKGCFPLLRAGLCGRATAVRLGSPLFCVAGDPASITQGHPVHRLPTTHISRRWRSACACISAIPLPQSPDPRIAAARLLAAVVNISSARRQQTIMPLFGGILASSGDPHTLDRIKRVAYMLAAASCSST
ncbi:MAG: hypothetical protein IPJ33_15870 [Gammaproteobacteria bacterium]|nr:hypothetical protein [Gammaproteobacteria bacterium]